MKSIIGSCVASFSLLASAQQTGNFSSTSPFPTNAPVPGNYTGGLRPQVHFSPPQGFMNDPNGMFLGKDGVYHLYYQYNPKNVVAGNQHWGHATSKDLYHWDNQPIALYPPVKNSGVFSVRNAVPALHIARTLTHARSGKCSDRPQQHKRYVSHIEFPGTSDC
jgi:beta-fructofuranosidase